MTVATETARLAEVRRDAHMRLWARYVDATGECWWQIRNTNLLYPGEDPIAATPSVPRTFLGRVVAVRRTNPKPVIPQ